MSKAVRGDVAVDNEAKELIAKINKFCAGDLGHRNMDNLSFPILKEFTYSLDVAKANAEYSAKTKMEQKLGSLKGQLSVLKRKLKELENKNKPNKPKPNKTDKPKPPLFRVG